MMESMSIKTLLEIMASWLHIAIQKMDNYAIKTMEKSAIQ